ncbi:hypothetical protein [Sinorhizobium americanum]|uniref:hypothetical protein n=1 Tax=Sinorhizobium americanum TaxID=194963 RepID=UPI00137B712A|nr:hypothetical protein [Sinorhizobium americanum]
MRTGSVVSLSRGVVVVLADGSRAVVATNDCHVDGVALRLAPSTIYWKGVGVDHRIGRCGGDSFEETIVTIVGTPGAARACAATAGRSDATCSACAACTACGCSTYTATGKGIASPCTREGKAAVTSATGCRSAGSSPAAGSAGRSAIRSGTAAAAITGSDTGTHADTNASAERIAAVTGIGRAAAVGVAGLTESDAVAAIVVAAVASVIIATRPRSAR